MYNLKPSLQFPFSNLNEGHLEQIFTRLLKRDTVKFAVEVGSFHGHSALLQ